MSEKDRKSKGRMEAFPARDGDAGEVCVAGHIFDPYRLCLRPDSARQALSNCESLGARGLVERMEVGAWLLPRLNAAQHLLIRIKSPNCTYRPVKTIADSL